MLDWYGYSLCNGAFTFFDHKETLNDLKKELNGLLIIRSIVERETALLIS